MPCFVIRQALRPLIPGCHAEDNLLSLAATCIRSWAKLDADSLRYLSTQNFVDMALILTGTGPQYVLKQQTAQALRINKMLYISNDFADLVLAKAIKHRGKVHTMFNDITSDWVSRGSSCALLGCRRGDTRQAVFQEVMALKPVRDLHAGLVEAATERQEWLVCSHDATYQVLFSAIGQVPMQQKQGEFHALHTFLGRSGAVPGFSLQRTEGPAQFRAAIAEVLPQAARDTVKYIFSDSPTSVEGAAEVLPNLEAVAEDALHLVLRVEACTGEKRTALSSCLLKIQTRFRLPYAAPFFRGHAVEDPPDAGNWSDNLMDKEATETDWDKKAATPYCNHQEYINDIQALCTAFPDNMGHKDKKGRTIRQILKAGASYTHFRYLWNGSHIISALHDVLPPAELQLLSFGTCSNEALHFQLKACQEQIIQQHIQTFPPQLQAFSLAKMLAHHSAAYFHTLAQRKESEILSLMQGCLKKGFLPALEEGQVQPIISRQDLRKPVRRVDPGKLAARKETAAKKAAQWKKETRNRQLKNKEKVQHKGAFKRTVFTQQKCLGRLTCTDPQSTLIRPAQCAVTIALSLVPFRCMHYCLIRNIGQVFFKFNRLSRALPNNCMPGQCAMCFLKLFCCAPTSTHIV